MTALALTVVALGAAGLGLSHGSLGRVEAKMSLMGVDVALAIGNVPDAHPQDVLFAASLARRDSQHQALGIAIQVSHDLPGKPATSPCPYGEA
jgi:hypothetical protein